MIIEFIQAIPFSFAAIVPVLNPLGSAVIFLGLTQGIPSENLPYLANKIAIYTFVLLVTVLLIGTWILRFFGISIPVVQIAGGLVVAYIGWNMLNKNSDSASTDLATSAAQHNINTIAFFPLTMPITAGPGCIAVAITIGAHAITPVLIPTIMKLAGMILGILLAAGTVFFCYRYANRLIKMLGTTGAQVIVRLSAFVNLCIGIEIIWHGVRDLLLTKIN